MRGIGKSSVFRLVVLTGTPGHIEALRVIRVIRQCSQEFDLANKCVTLLCAAADKGCATAHKGVAPLTMVVTSPTRV